MEASVLSHQDVEVTRALFSDFSVANQFLESRYRKPALGHGRLLEYRGNRKNREAHSLVYVRHVALQRHGTLRTNYVEFPLDALVLSRKPA